MADKKLSFILESFMGGIFGGKSVVPWDGQETPVEDLSQNNQITTSLDGTETYVIGGGVLTSVIPNSEANAKRMSIRILTYRNMQYYVEVDEAIDHVINDIITNEGDESPIAINLDRLELSESIKDKIREAHDKISRLMDLEDNAYEVFRQFYVDGRRGYQIILDEKGKGIKKLVCLDPVAIRPVTLVETEHKDNIEIVKSERKTYLYDSTATSQSGVNTWVMSINQNKILELPFESVAFSDAGMYTSDGRSSVGFLEPAVKPANNLKTVEDGNVIYSITRAIDKRAFLLDVGDLPKKSAEEYIVKMMEKFKTKLNYNTETGDIDRNKTNISMVEDYWLPRRDGQQATEIQNLEAGRNIGEVNHIQYFRDKLYRSLKIPTTRQSPDAMVNIGGSDLAQITREEWKFNRHTGRVKKRFNAILKQILKVELIQKKIVNSDEWEEIKDKIGYDYAADSYVAEQQETELMMGRINAMREAEPYVGKIFSIQTIKKNILRLSDEEIEQEEKQIAEEKKAGLYDDIGESPLQMKKEDETGQGGFEEPETPPEQPEPQPGSLNYPAAEEPDQIPEEK
jgi:hypothetical protein